MRSTRCLGLVVALALLAGCGGGSGGGGGGGSSSGPVTPEMQQPGVVMDGRVVVDITQQGFRPDRLTIPAETQVVWTNSDNVEHSIVKRRGPGADFNSGPLQPGSTFSQVLEETGEYVVADEATQANTPPRMTIVVEPQEEAEPAPGGPPPEEPPPGG